MTFSLPNTLDVIEIMENYIARVRPPENIRDQLDINYRIDNQSVILFEIRPSFRFPDQKIESEFAKATYVRTGDHWKVFWKRASGKWNSYPPMPTVKTLKD